MKIYAVLVLVCLMTKLNARSHDKVVLLENPVPVSSVKNITGFYGGRMKLNRDIYLKNFPINRFYRGTTAYPVGLDKSRTTWQMD